MTGVDLSEGILDIAKQTNPEIEYLKGDIRDINLNRHFDVLAIPDSIMYMKTREDLTAAIKNAAAHLNPWGVLLVFAHTREEFRNNNFAYTGEEGNVHVTVLENNHIVSPTTYEAVMIHLIRTSGELSIHHEVYTLGLFSHEEWLDIFKMVNLQVREINLDHLHDQYLLEDGEYKLTVFIGTFMPGGE